MEFRYLEQNEEHPLIDHFFELKINTEDIPFTSLILPLGQTNITYVSSSEKQKITYNNNKEIYYDDLIVSGQFYGSFQVSILETSYNYGFALKPTSLYKITGKDISEFSNSHLNLAKIDEKIHRKLKPIFENNIDNVDDFIQSIYHFFENHTYIKDDNVTYIDAAIDLIEEKEGLLKVSDLLKITPFSQKKLELQFKKIIGLTPGKFIKQYRFMKLMRKYESNQISMNDLKYMFNYYDPSHFSKDFHFFMNQTPKAYFKNNYPLLKSYLKE